MKTLYVVVKEQIQYNPVYTIVEKVGTKTVGDGYARKIVINNPEQMLRNEII